MNKFKNLIKELDAPMLLKPESKNEYDSQWKIGYNHIFNSDYEYDQYSKGISVEQVDEFFEQDLQLLTVGLRNTYDEKFGNGQYNQLSEGNQLLLLSLILNAGDILSYTKLLEKVQEGKFYEAIQLNERKNILNKDVDNQLKKRCEQERNFFQQNFDQNGNPNEQNQQQNNKQAIPDEEELQLAYQLIEIRISYLEQYNIFPLNTQYSKLNYKDQLFIDFLMDQESQKYNKAGYNTETNKWHLCQVADQSKKIIGYSHICSQQQEIEFAKGLTDSEAKVLFKIDYDEKLTLLLRYLRRHHKENKFEELNSQCQLLLMDIAFNNQTFETFENIIKLALQNNIQEALQQYQQLNYIPNEEVDNHYYKRIQNLKGIINKVDENYKLEKSDWKDKKFESIVGVQIIDGNFSFILDENAKLKTNMKDLITCFKVIYDPNLIPEGENEICFSLDPKDGNINSPVQEKTYLPEYLAKSRLGEILYESDFLLKQMSLGIKLQSQNPLQLTQFDYQGLQLQPVHEIGDDYFSRLTLKLKKLQARKSKFENRSEFIIDDVLIKVDAETITEEGDIQVVQEQNDPSFIFAQQFTDQYDNIGQQYPVFIRLQEAFMAIYLAKYIFFSDIKLDYNNISQLFEENLIKQNVSLESPTLRLDVTKGNSLVSLTGGVDGSNGSMSLKMVAQDQNTVHIQIDLIDQSNPVEVETVSSLSRCSTAESLPSFIQEQKKNCQKCLLELELQENNDQICKSCKNEQCNKCYKNCGQLKKIGQIDSNLCGDCFKCKICNLQNPNNITQQKELVHLECLQKLDSLKFRKMKKYIMENFKSLNKQTSSRGFPVKTYYVSNIECVKNLQYIGFYHKQQKSNAKQTFDTNDSTYLLDQDLQECQNKILDFVTSKNLKYSQLKEEMRLLIIFTQFISQSKVQVTNLLNANTYEMMLNEIPLLKCENKKNHKCDFNIRKQQMYTFFTDLNRKQQIESKPTQQKK